MKHSINIMQVVLNLECGGLEKMVIDLTKSFNIAGVKTTICCIDKLGILANQAKIKGIEVILVKKRRGFDITFPFRLAYVLRQRKIDVVHTHNTSSLLYGTLAAKLAKTPVIINTRHGRAKRYGHTFIWNMNDFIIAISEDAKRQMLKWNSIDIRKTKVLYNGIDIEKYSNKINICEAKKTLNINPSTFVIGTVARLSVEKDQFILINAFSEAAKRIPDLRLVFVGDGALRKELEDYSKELGLYDKIIFLGFRNDVSDILPTFDVFALSSLTEGISLTLLEAMAAGKPIVATNVGGNPEVVIDGVTGFLVPPKDPEKMAQAIIKILQNPDMAKKMGEAGRRRVEEKFSLERMVREYEELYEECLARKGVGCRV